MRAIKNIDDIEEERRIFCLLNMCEPCETCKISFENNGTRENCVDFVKNNPTKALELMGYEVHSNIYQKNGADDLIRQLKDLRESCRSCESLIDCVIDDVIQPSIGK